MDVFSPAQLLGYLAFVLGVVAFAQRIDWRLKLLVATSWTAVFAIGAGLAGTVAAFFLTGIGLRALLLVATLCWLTNNRLSGSIAAPCSNRPSPWSTRRPSCACGATATAPAPWAG